MVEERVADWPPFPNSGDVFAPFLPPGAEGLLQPVVPVLEASVGPMLEASPIDACRRAKHGCTALSYKPCPQKQQAGEKGCWMRVGEGSTLSPSSSKLAIYRLA